MSDVPNVNFFIGYVDNLRGKAPNDAYVQENLEARRFYSSGKDYDYVKYVSSGSKEKIDFVEYSGNNEKSTGIFNENGLMNEQQIKELRAKLRKTNSPIWHGVISFTTEFGDNFCNTYEKAYELMKAEFPKFFEKAHLDPNNIEWFAGLHENTDNKHIHFSFFEKSPYRTKIHGQELLFSDGFIPIEAINSFKVSAEMRLLNINKEIAYARESLTLEFKKIAKNGDYMKDFRSLAFILPKTGRIGYDSANMEQFRPQINLIVSTIINADKDLRKKYSNFERFLSKRDNELIKAYEKIKVNYNDKLLHDKCLADIYRRLGNIVIKAAIELYTDEKKLERETKNRLIAKRIDKLKRKALIRKCMQLNDMVNREIISAFQEYLDKLEEANFKRLKEEGYLD